MNTTLMPNRHQPEQAAPWAWALAGDEVRTLAAAPQDRWLRVEAGCLWVTRQDSQGQREDDVWLGAGESLALPSGSAWVLQAWPLADVSLLQQAPFSAPRRASSSQGWLSWLAALAPQRLRASLLHAA